MTVKALTKKSHVNSFILSCFIALNIHVPVNAEQIQKLNMDQWLKSRFGAQHDKLIPIVAVADMFFSCQKQKKVKSDLTIKALITKIDKNELAEQLTGCLAGESPKSDTALNYGLMGCFHEQLSNLSSEEKEQKMRLVIKAIAALSRAERQKSFTQCVTEQSISYLK